MPAGDHELLSKHRQAGREKRHLHAFCRADREQVYGASAHAGAGALGQVGARAGRRVHGVQMEAVRIGVGEVFAEARQRELALHQKYDRRGDRS